MTVPEIRSHLLAALDGFMEVVEQLEPYRSVLPGVVLYSMRALDRRLISAMALLDDMDRAIYATLSTPPPAKGSTQGLG
jgi:hypothetical protein